VEGNSVSPEELFSRLAPSVFVVEALSENGKVVSSGSGVVVQPGCIVSNKHVLGNEAKPRAKHGSRRWAARITHVHPELDLCQLHVEALDAPAVSTRAYATLCVGERVYAIGAPQGFDLTLSDGLISGLRKRRGIDVIQTTAPISKGSSGGGLFDEAGNLVGITTYFMEDGQALNFALPADQIAALLAYQITDHRDESLGQDTEEGSDSELIPHELIEEQKYGAALKVLAHSSAQKPQSEEVWFWLGFCYHKVRLYQEAVRAFRRATSLRADFADAWYFLGCALAWTEDFEDATHAYKEAIRLRPGNVETWLGLAQSYREGGLREEALAANNEAIRLRPDYPQAHCGLGWFYLHTNHYAKAIEAFREAVRLDPDRPDLWSYLAIAYYKQGDRKILYQVLGRLEELDPRMAREFRRKWLRTR
jgi:cytochrome c-type biogenesis protein CcmH/NrfG